MDPKTLIEKARNIIRDAMSEDADWVSASAHSILTLALESSADALEDERGGWRDWPIEEAGCDRAAGVCWSAERLRSLSSQIKETR